MATRRFVSPNEKRKLVEPACVEENGRGRGGRLQCAPAPHSCQHKGSAVQQEDVAEQNPRMILAPVESAGGVKYPPAKTSTAMACEL